MGLLQLPQIAQQSIVLGIGEGRLGQHVVAMVVFAYLLAEAFDLSSDSAHQRILPSRAAGVKHSFDLSEEIQFSPGLKIHLWAGVS